MYGCTVIEPGGDIVHPDSERDFEEQFPKPKFVRLDSPRTFDVARFFEEIPDIGADEVYVVIVPDRGARGQLSPTTQSKSTQVEERHEKLFAKHPPIYDVFDESNALHIEMRKTTSRFSNRLLVRPQLVYAGKPPIEYEMVMLREKMLQNATRAFNMSFIAPFSSGEKRTRQNVSIDKVMNLLNAFGLGYFDFDKNVYEGYSKTKEIAAMMRLLDGVEFAEHNDDACIAAAEDLSRQADELLDLWDDMSREVRFAIRLDRSELGDRELVEKLIREYADLIDMESAVDALAAGVPLDDVKFGD